MSNHNINVILYPTQTKGEWLAKCVNVSITKGEQKRQIRSHLERIGFDALEMGRDFQNNVWVTTRKAA